MIESKVFSPVPESSIGELGILVKSLINSLQKEIHVYRQLYQVIKNEREIIRRPSIEALCVNNSKKEACFLKAQVCKGCREEITKAIEKICPGGCAGEMDLSLIPGYAESDVRQRFLDCRDRLYSLINAVKKLNDKNLHLLQGSITHTGSTLMFIQKFTSGPVNYMPSGQLPMTMPNGKILNKEG